MSLSTNEHRVLRALFTNHYALDDSEKSVQIVRINDCNEPCNLDMRTVLSTLGGLVKKRLVVVHYSGLNSVIQMTKKGIRKAETFGAS